MSKEEVIEILGKIINCHYNVIENEKELLKVKNSCFPKSVPLLNKDYIVIKAKNTIKINWGFFILLIFITGGIGNLVYYIFINIKRDKFIQDEYVKRLDEYNNIEIPNYEKEYKEWKENYNFKIEKLSNEISLLKIELEKMYNDSNLIPIQYRTIDAEKYIYETISTSNYDIIQAIENYDRNVHLQLEKERLNELKYANDLAKENNKMVVQQNELISQQNQTLEEGNKLARTNNYLVDVQNRKIDKMRKNNNLANAIGIVQRHNTNKILKDMKK